MEYKTCNSFLNGIDIHECLVGKDEGYLFDKGTLHCIVQQNNELINVNEPQNC